MEPAPSGMAIDPEYDEKLEVAEIPGDESMDEAEPLEPLIRADDFEAIKKRHMPLLEGLEVEAEAIDTWTIENWRTLPKRTNGPVFHSGGYPWRVLFFPQGNNVDHASFYLEHGFQEKVPDDWYACAQFMLTLWNPNDPTVYVTHTANHRFNGEEADWGFTRFAELRKLFQPRWEDRDRPMVENNSAKLTAYVRIYKDPTGVLWHNFINYDSKKETGMVGLKNQGATCYLNSLLQSLYFTHAFRKAVYQIPTEDEDDSKANSGYALQRLFYLLQSSDSAVSTNELTRAFGWDSRQIFEQQDVQELSRILMERLEDRMKGTEAQDALGKMFIGKSRTYIKCINVNAESFRIEEFWDIQLNVSGNETLDDSFRDYIAVETMDGENKYQAEGYGLQDAKKGVIFESFPEVLHLQLKRFEYDFNRDTMMKINDRYEFPEIWDASPYLSEEADRSEPWIYRLHGVLVHSGDLNAGHYYAFLKPQADGEWYRFDDDRVMKALPREAISDNFGGEASPQANGQTAGQRNPYTRTWTQKRSNNAYMLVYIRESRLNNILSTDDDVRPPEHLAEKFARERLVAEKLRKDREEAHLYMEVSVATDKQFKAFQGFDIVPWKDFVSEETQPKSFRVPRSMSVEEFIAHVATDMGLEVKKCRPWAIVNRQNGTSRPDRPLSEPDMSIEDAANRYGTKSTNFRVWMEVSDDTDKDGHVIFGDAYTGDNPTSRPIVLFLKHFDVEQQTLFGMGHFYALQQDKAADIAPHILKIMGWPKGTMFTMFEEIKHNMIEPIKGKQTLAQSEIQDGDVITVQRTFSEKELSVFAAAGKHTDVREFYDLLLHKTKVRFAPKNSEDGEEFQLELSKRMNYTQLAQKVAERLGPDVDPTHIRFCPVNATNGRPKAPLRHVTHHNLGAMLTPGFQTYGQALNQRHDALYYEVLEVSLSELETRKVIKVTWLPEGLAKEETYEVLVPKNGTVADIVAALRRKTPAGYITNEMAGRVRVYETHACKIFKECALTYPVANLNEFIQLYAEPTPEGEFLGEIDEENEYLVPALHFDKEPSKTHGVPFLFLMKKGEVFKDTKERLSKRTGIKGKALERIKFAVVPRSSYAKADYLTDDDILWDKMTTGESSLGLDHLSKTRNNWNRADSIFIK
ncbi:ubiquitin carboxyl-terminal hydrolase 21 [Venturia nashicola]|uniref:ubiquitinyl hydrolase 1 n=1 Tax=Venturia nashicola TaxID=86259 RepID=A0A4Z1P3R3_9PEZI|nr:ubiquitin carboxyl-terminal hydrolase 21 [Venturia nashicola]